MLCFQIETVNEDNYRADSLYTEWDDRCLALCQKYLESDNSQEKYNFYLTLKRNYWYYKDSLLTRTLSLENIKYIIETVDYDLTSYDPIHYEALIVHSDNQIDKISRFRTYHCEYQAEIFENPNQKCIVKPSERFKEDPSYKTNTSVILSDFTSDIKVSFITQAEKKLLYELLENNHLKEICCPCLRAHLPHESSN